jgi:hypothetical protein
MPLLEQNYYGLWWGRQTAKGTAQATPSRRGIMVGGDFAINRDDGEENYSDLTKYGARTDWVNSLTGTAEPVLEATPTELAHLLWLMHGGEAVAAQAAVTGPPAIPAMSRHRFTPATTMGHWSTFYLRVGSSVVRRHRFADSVITRIAIEASSANKAARVTPRILSLDPAETFAAAAFEPAGGSPVALPSDRPFLFTDLGQVGASASATIDGALTIDGTTFRGVTQFTFTIDDAWEPVYGDGTAPYDFVQGSPAVTIGTTIYADAAGYAQFNKLVYGTTSPAAGTKPLKAIPANGSFKGTLRTRDTAGAHAGRELVVDVPAVKWALPDAPGPNPDGGTAELALAGTMRPPGGSTQPYTVDVFTADSVATFTT